MSASDSEAAYSVLLVDDHYEVRGEADRVVVNARDQHSAEHYAVLLNQAYATGFKAGYRAAKAMR